MEKIKLFAIGFILYLIAFFILNLLPLPFFQNISDAPYPFDQNITKYCSLNYWYCYNDFGGIASDSSNFPKILKSSIFSLFILPIFLPLIFSISVLRKFYIKK